MAHQGGASSAADDGPEAQKEGERPVPEEVVDLRERMESRTQIEELIASVAAGLIVGDPGDPRIGLEEALGSIGEILGADRACFARSDHEGRDLTVVEWAAPGIPHGGQEREADLEVVRYWARVSRGDEARLVPDVSALEGDEAVGAILAAQGVQSVLVVPFRPDRRFVGFLAVMSVGRQQSFSEDAVSTLRIAGEIFLSALVRADAAAALADATAELAHRNEELEQSNEELQRFAYAAAHDLKAPLSRIEMALNALAKLDHRPEAAAAEMLGVAARGAVRMRALITDLLAYATLGEGLGARAPVDLGRVVEAAVSDLAGAIAERDIDVEVAPLPTVPGHETLLGQLFTNVLSNAVKFARADRQPVLRVDAERRGRDVLVAVRDNGPGIPPADRARVFGMFTRLQSSGPEPGSGIGLATCARVVAIHGGRIWVDDGIDGGIAVCISLPSG